MNLMPNVPRYTRYGEEYHFEKLEDNVYTVNGIEVQRAGGKDGQTELNLKDLGWVDFPGGPFIGLGYNIGSQKVVKISIDKPGVLLEVE